MDQQSSQQPTATPPAKETSTSSTPHFQPKKGKGKGRGGSNPSGFKATFKQNVHKEFKTGSDLGADITIMPPERSIYVPIQISRLPSLVEAVLIALKKASPSAIVNDLTPQRIYCLKRVFLKLAEAKLVASARLPGQHPDDFVDTSGWIDLSTQSMIVSSFPKVPTLLAMFIDAIGWVSQPIEVYPAPVRPYAQTALRCLSGFPTDVSASIEADAGVPQANRPMVHNLFNRLMGTNVVNLFDAHGRIQRAQVEAISPAPEQGVPSGLLSADIRDAASTIAAMQHFSIQMSDLNITNGTGSVAQFVRTDNFTGDFDYTWYFSPDLVQQRQAIFAPLYQLGVNSVTETTSRFHVQLAQSPFRFHQSRERVIAPLLQKTTIKL